MKTVNQKLIEKTCKFLSTLPDDFWGVLEFKRVRGPGHNHEAILVLFGDVSACVRVEDIYVSWDKGKIGYSCDTIKDAVKRAIMYKKAYEEKYEIPF